MMQICQKWSSLNLTSLYFISLVALAHMGLAWNT
jgi:hypothetical protein